MKISHAKVLITFLFYIDTAFPENIEIIRSLDRPNGGKKDWRDGIDSFHIPQSVCYQESSGYRNYCNTSCTTDETENQGLYRCPCSEANATVTFLNNKWRCLGNQDVRSQLGCQVKVLFDDEQEEHGLYTLKADGEWRKIILNNGQLSCAIIISSSWYIGCSGKKVPLGRHTDKTRDIFKLGRRDGDYFIKVKYVESITDIFQGQVINLGFSCRRWPWATRKPKGCLLFKLEGTITCPVEAPTVPSFSSSITPRASSMETKLTASLTGTIKVTSLFMFAMTYVQYYNIHEPVGWSASSGGNNPNGDF
ncbi:uncharacterized protein LOC144628844 [Oculina patagonica]